MLSDKDYETETYFRFCKNDTRGYLYSADRAWVRIMKRWATDYPSDVVIRLDNKGGTEVELPVAWLNICPPKLPRKKNVKKQSN